MEVTKISIGKDKLIYFTVKHPVSTNWPSFTFKWQDIEKNEQLKNIFDSLIKYEI